MSIRMMEDKNCLSGKIFNITSFQLPKRFIIKSNGKEADGFAGELWMTIAKTLNFTLKINEYTKGNLLEYGKRQENGSWSGILGELETETTHIVPLLYMDNKRRYFVQYTIPFHLSGFRLAVKAESSSYFSWFWPLSPFSTSIWCVELIFLLLISLTIYLGQWIGIRIMNKKRSHRDFIGDLLHVLGSFCCQGQSANSFLAAVSVAALTGSILGYLLIQSYAANFISYITAISIWEPPFMDLEGLLKTDYKIVVMKGSYAHSKLEESRGDIYEKLWKKSFVVDSSDESYFHICSSKVASFASEITVDIPSPCNVVIVNDWLYFSTWKCSALSIDFPCKWLIDNIMLQLREAGIVNRLDTKFRPETSIKKAKNQLISPNIDDGVELQYITPIIVLYGIGIMLAVLMLTLEQFVASVTAV